MKLRSFLVMLILLSGAVFVACEGERGPAGEKGDPGVAGAKGDKGDKGDPGPTGADGRVGVQGAGYGDSRCDVSNGIHVILGIAMDVTGTADDDIICGNRADNTIRAGGGDDTVYGGGGNDYLQGQAGDDEIHGEDGIDRLSGGDGDDTLNGGDGNDHFYLRGEAGDNKFVGGADNDIIYCHSIPASNVALNSSSFYLGTAASANITFDLSSGSFDGSALSGTGTFTFEGIEDVICGTGADTITGNDLDNYLNGLGGNDTVNGGAGDDYVLGGSGDDTVNGGAGDDILTGFTGSDVFTGGTGADTFVIDKDRGLKIIKDFDLTEDKIYFKDFPTSNRAVTASAGKISVGGTEYVEIQVSGTANPARATSIAGDSTKYKFVAGTWNGKTRRQTYTDN